MRIIRFSILVLSLLSILITYTGCEQKEEKIVKVGAVLPLTGPLSELGQDEKFAMEMALENFYSNSEPQIIPIYEDSKGTAKDGLNAVNKLKLEGIDKIVVSLTPPVQTVLETYKNNKELIFITQCVAPNILENKTNAVRIYYNVEGESENFYRYLKKNEVGSVFIFYINNDFGLSAINSLKNRIKDLSVELDEESYGFVDKDFRQQLLKVSNANPDVLIIYGYPQQYPQILDQLIEINYSGTIIANSGIGRLIEDQKYLDTQLSNNIIISAPNYVISESEAATKFRTSFIKEKGKEPTWDAIYFYDMMTTLAKVIEPEKTNEQILHDIKLLSYEGISGRIAFNENGDLISQDNLTLVEYNKNGYIKIEY